MLSCPGKLTLAKKGGLKHSEESKKKIGAASKGEKNPFFGKKHSLESREKIIKSLISRGGMSGKNNPFYGKKQLKSVVEKHSKMVVNLETGIFYDSAKEASEATYISYTYFRGMLNGARPNKTNFTYVSNS